MFNQLLQCLFIHFVACNRYCTFSCISGWFELVNHGQKTDYMEQMSLCLFFYTFKTFFIYRFHSTLKKLGCSPFFLLYGVFCLLCYGFPTCCLHHKVLFFLVSSFILFSLVSLFSTLYLDDETNVASETRGHKKGKKLPQDKKT